MMYLITCLCNEDLILNPYSDPSIPASYIPNTSIYVSEHLNQKGWKIW